MKIKTTKQINLPQLIEWGFKQEVLPPMFHGSRNGSVVQFTPGGWVNIDGIEPTDLFTIEVEKEITEDTRLDLIERFIGGMGYACYTSHGDITIKECLRRSPEECTTTHFYIENDNRELVLIWRDGKLVE